MTTLSRPINTLRNTKHWRTRGKASPAQHTRLLLRQHRTALTRKERTTNNRLRRHTTFVSVSPAINTATNAYREDKSTTRFRSRWAESQLFPPSFHYYTHCERAPLSYTRCARDSFSAPATRLKSLTVLFRNRCLYVAAPNWKYTYTALFPIIAVFFRLLASAQSLLQASVQNKKNTTIIS